MEGQAVLFILSLGIIVIIIGRRRRQWRRRRERCVCSVGGEEARGFVGA